MNRTITTSMFCLAAAGVLLVALAAAGCASKPTAPVTKADRGATNGSVPATPAPAAEQDTSPATGTAGGVDAAGAAVGSSLTVGSAGKSRTRGGIDRPTDKAATNAAVRELREDEQIGKVQRISVRSMTQDSKGRWWVLVAIRDNMAGSNEAVVTYDGKSWEYVVFGEGISNNDLPPDVRF